MNVNLPDVRILLSTLIALSACTTPCDHLADHATSCRVTPSRYVDDQRSACTATRTSVGAKSFDNFAQCFSESDCDDTNALDRCISAEMPAVVSPCQRFALWASACGLEPVGIDNDCASLRDNMTEAVFDSWVECITVDGCPHGDDDPRYDRCQDVILPPSTANLIDACVLVTEWSNRCAEEVPEWFPVTETTVPACIVQADVFTTDSYLEYAICLSDVPCDDIALRVNCLLMLRLVDGSGAVAPCERLLLYAHRCNTPLGGGNLDVCMRLFARFTPESFDDYVSCIEERPCDDAGAALACGPLLQLQ